MKEKYYLYQHIRLDKNEPFYIGIGTIQKSQQSSIKQEILYYRAFSKIRRNSIWNKIVNKTDYSIEILITSDNYDFIKSKEIELIEKYGKIYLNTGILSNLTDGGEGTNGYKASIQTRKKYSKRMINVKRLGFCGVYAQSFFHAIEPNQCYTKFLFFAMAKHKLKIYKN